MKNRFLRFIFDLILFFMAYEVMVVPMYFLIGIWGSKNRIYATMKFVIYSLVGSLAMFLSFLWIYYNGIQSFSLEQMLAADLGTVHVRRAGGDERALEELQVVEF